MSMLLLCARCRPVSASAVNGNNRHGLAVKNVSSLWPEVLGLEESGNLFVASSGRFLYVDSIQFTQFLKK